MFRLVVFQACVCALCLATTTTAAGDISEAAQGIAALADLNRKVDGLSSKIEMLTVSVAAL